MNNFSMTTLFIGVLLFSIVVYLLGCDKNDKLSPGGLYSVNSENGKYGIIKVLVMDSNVVHIKIYANSFETRPIELDTSKLTLGTIHDKEFGIGHMPIEKQELLRWEPRLIMHQSVSKEELKGYNLWKEENGGVFGIQ
ncbi:MAG: hypothetical protein WAR59_04710 [Ignavibacteriaceae bacterium]